MKRGKSLYVTTLKNYKHADTQYDVNLAVYGLFETNKALWKYYIVSYIILTSNTGKIVDRLVEDLAIKNMSEPLVFSIYSIENYFTTTPSVEEGTSFIEDYKIKWETGSNSSSQEKRDKKLGEILD